MRADPDALAQIARRHQSVAEFEARLPGLAAKTALWLLGLGWLVVIGGLHALAGWHAPLLLDFATGAALVWALVARYLGRGWRLWFAAALLLLPIAFGLGLALMVLAVFGLLFAAIVAAAPVTGKSRRALATAAGLYFPLGTGAVWWWARQRARPDVAGVSGDEGGAQRSGPYPAPATAPGWAQRAATVAAAEPAPAPYVEQELPPPRPAADVLAQLDAMIGLAAVKREMRELVAFLEVQKQRREHGLPTPTTSNHLIFAGNPGTGKTTVARLVGELYRSLGLLARGHVVETDRAKLVGEYVGHTAVKTLRVLDQARDGVLFLDEAYALAPPDNPRDFGREALETILARMENERDRLVVIAAGYPDLMRDDFLGANPGLASRFGRTIAFDDYADAELLEILEGQVADGGYKLAPGCREAALAIFADTPRGRGFGNARFARNLFESAMRAHAARLSGRIATREELALLTPDDFRSAAGVLADNQPEDGQGNDDAVLLEMLRRVTSGR